MKADSDLSHLGRVFCSIAEKNPVLSIDRKVLLAKTELPMDKMRLAEQDMSRAKPYEWGFAAKRRSAGRVFLRDKVKWIFSGKGEPMKFTETLYETAKPIWEGYLAKPFVRELGEGTLAPEKFRFYMIQDYRYLLEYVRIFALGVVKAKEESVQRLFADLVQETLGGEMQVHRAYMERLGITETELAQSQSAPANRAYTDYMLREAYAGGVEEILAAVLSCAWSYQMIGLHHQNIPGAAAHPLYGEWIASYSSAAYCAGTKRLLDLLDVYGENLDAARKAHLTEIFVKCSQYESDFWDMAYAAEWGKEVV